MTRQEWVRSLITESDGVLRVKLCGMTRPADVAAASAAAPDLCGFVVDVPRSRRSVTADELRRLVPLLDAAVVSVGIFVDEPVEAVASLARDGVIDVAQLHGHEDEGYLSALRAACDVPVIQAFRVRGAADVARANASAADLVLLDNDQGTGERFDWSLVSAARRPFVLAGGLAPGRIAPAVSSLRSAVGDLLWGIDMSSGVETDGGKDPARMRAAVEEARTAGAT